MTDHSRPLVITVGEPAGVGPDIAVKITQETAFQHPLVILGDARVLKERANQLKLGWNIPLYNKKSTPAFSLLDWPLPYVTQAGKPDTRNNSAVLAGLDRAIQGCLNQEFAALVTGPINKAVMHQTQSDFCGHTEYLAKATKVETTVMLFTYKQWRLALLTTHVPLKDVASLITEERLTKTLQILQHDLKTQFNIKAPKILVTGLNPHAGDQGAIGREEIEIIEPTLKKLRLLGFDLVGPVSADTLFQFCKKNPVDAILSLYHDQSLPVLKTLGFGELVNVTLGLPFIRTSVDHGTAFDIAGTEAADATGLFSAVQLAIQLVEKNVTPTA